MHQLLSPEQEVCGRESYTAHNAIDQDLSASHLCAFHVRRHHFIPPPPPPLPLPAPTLTDPYWWLRSVGVRARQAHVWHQVKAGRDAIYEIAIICLAGCWHRRLSQAAGGFLELSTLRKNGKERREKEKSL